MILQHQIFPAKVDFQASSLTDVGSIAIGYLNGDGKLDFAVVGSASNVVSVFRNTATSGSIVAYSFATPVNFSVNSSNYSVAIGDIDGDGRPDLIAANYGDSTVSVLRNTGLLMNANLSNLTISAGTGSIKYTYTNTAGCINSRTMSGNGYTCAARGVNTVDGQQSTVDCFTIYSNPAKGSVNLNVETLIGKGSIVITDLYGKTVKTQNLSMGTNTVNIANLSKGFYLVSMITSEGKTTKKLVVE